VRQASAASESHKRERVRSRPGEVETGTGAESAPIEGSSAASRSSRSLSSLGPSAEDGGRVESRIDRGVCVPSLAGSRGVRDAKNHHHTCTGSRERALVLQSGAEGARSSSWLLALGSWHSHERKGRREALLRLTHVGPDVAAPTGTSPAARATCSACVAVCAKKNRRDRPRRPACSRRTPRRSRRWQRTSTCRSTSSASASAGSPSTTLLASSAVVTAADEANSLHPGRGLARQMAG